MICKVTHPVSSTTDYPDNMYFNNDENFFPDNEVNPDLWKKFELITPPLSPEHPSFSEQESDITSYSSTSVDLTDVLTSIVKEGMQNSETEQCNNKENQTADVCSKSCVKCKTKALQTFLLKDCMWSGTGLIKDIATHVNSTKNVPQVNKPAQMVITPVQTASETASMEAVSPDCVAPSSIFRAAYTYETPSDSGKLRNSVELSVVVNLYYLIRLLIFY